MAAAAAHAVKNNRKLHPKDGTVGQVQKIVLNREHLQPILPHKMSSKCVIIIFVISSKYNSVVIIFCLLSRSIKTLFVEVVINSPARNGWGETAEALHGEIAKVATF